MKFLYKIFVTLSFLMLVNLSLSASEILGPSEPRIRIIQCYPNPAITNIYFEFLKPSEKNCTLYIYNFIGKKVEEIKVSSSKVAVNLETYYRGLYVFQLRDKQGTLLESGKFQVVK
jgi:Secretion system C-terminal sorting domain